MNLKRINQQIKELANRLPVRLCQISPDKLTADDVISLQNGIHASANLTEQTNTVIKLLAEEVQVLRNEIAEIKNLAASSEVCIRAVTPLINLAILKKS